MKKLFPVFVLFTLTLFAVTRCGGGTDVQLIVGQLGKISSPAGVSKVVRLTERVLSAPSPGIPETGRSASTSPG